MVSGDEPAEAELFQSSARLLVLFCGEECGAQSLFQLWIEGGAHNDGLLRRAGTSRNRILKTLGSIAAASASPLRTASIEFR